MLLLKLKLCAAKGTIILRTEIPASHLISTAREMTHATIWCARHPPCVKTVHPITCDGGIIKISLGFKEYMPYCVHQISHFPLSKNSQLVLVSYYLVVILRQRTLKCM